MPEVVIGKDAITGELITLGNLERQGGVHLFGCSGTGKSRLLLSLLLQDIQMSEAEEDRPCQKSSSAKMPSRRD